jgi:hypothetical protein
MARCPGASYFCRPMFEFFKPAKNNSDSNTGLTYAKMRSGFVILP